MAKMRRGPSSQPRKERRQPKPTIKKDESIVTMTTDSVSNTGGDRDGGCGIWYFGYGPIVHPTVRRRREIFTLETRAAILPDHRLTFAYGGVVNIVPQRGFEVHGVLIKVENEEEWEKLRKFDSGTYVPQILQVYPYPAECNEEEQIFNNFGDDSDGEETVRARVFVMTSFNDVDLDKPVERKPQERYLRLIQQGMRQEGVDEDYISDFIMATPYIPSRKPEEWQSFPSASSSSDITTLPKISLQKYKKICATSTRRKNCNDIYFVMQGNVVHKLGPHEENNPLALWTRDAAHGNEDITLLIHKMIVDPNIPMVEHEDELTECHYNWAENHMYEVLQQSGLTAQKVYRLAEERQGSVRSRSDRQSATHSSSVHSSGSSGSRGDACHKRNWRRPFVRSAIKASHGD